METIYLKQIIEMAEVSKENLNIRKEIILDEMSDGELGKWIREMYRAKVREADETIKNITNKINGQ
jgi:hypothetical protein